MNSPLQIGPYRYPLCEQCYQQGQHHIDQTCKSVHKHQHMDDKPCPDPWTALCQTEHGELCHFSDHTTQQKALNRLLEHLVAQHRTDNR